MDFITRQRTVRAIQRAAAARGFNGDIWADNIPSLGTLQQELAICDISIDASPGPMNQWDFAFFKRLVRAAVLTGSPNFCLNSGRSNPVITRAWQRRGK